MALVNIVNMVVLDNPCNFSSPFQFEITFECLQELEDDLEWKVLYVGSAHDTSKDQILDEILVGPVPVGVNKFVLQADAPVPQRLPPDEILGVTVVLVTCSYRNREFVRVGYYVNNELQGYDPENDGPPPVYPNLNLSLVQRQILADKPRVTRFPIRWGAGNDNEMGVTHDQNPQEINSYRQQANQDPAMEAKMATAMDNTLRGTLASANTDDQD